MIWELCMFISRFLRIPILFDAGEAGAGQVGFDL